MWFSGFLLQDHKLRLNTGVNDSTENQNDSSGEGSSRDGVDKALRPEADAFANSLRCNEQLPSAKSEMRLNPWTIIQKQGRAGS